MKYSVFIFLLIAVACASEVKKQKQDIDWNKEKSVQLNRSLALEEEIQIKFFLESHKDWDAVSTGSGLIYAIIEKGTGEIPQIGQTADVVVDVKLLDGTACYASKPNDYESFVVDKSNVESGIQEAVKLMHVGDHAKLIIPSHLAHGLTGDMNKIPPLTVIVVDLKLIKVRS